MGTSIIKGKVIIIKDERDSSNISELEQYISEGYSILNVTALYVDAGAQKYGGVATGSVIYTLRHVEQRF